MPRLYTLPQTHLSRPSSVERSRTPSMQCSTHQPSINPHQNEKLQQLQYTPILHRKVKKKTQHVFVSSPLQPCGSCVPVVPELR